jgi:hypothetical protein
MPQHDPSHPSPPWERPVRPETLMELLFQYSHYYHPTETWEPMDNPFQKAEQLLHLEMPRMWAEQAKRWSPVLRFNILAEVANIKDNCQPLFDLGADPDVVVQVVSALKSDPSLRYAPTLLRNASPEHWVKTSEEIRKLADMRRELEGWTNNPIFRELPPDTQACIRRDLTDAVTQHERLSMPLKELRRRAEAEDPLLPLLERSQSTRRGRGRPSQAKALLCMVLLTDHLRAQTKRPRYSIVGQVAKKLFPGCIPERIPTSSAEFRLTVQDRCKKFKKKLGDHLHDLQAVIFTNPTL